MANQRMYVLCTKCLVDAPSGGLDMDKATMYLGKYYPSDGWFTNDRNLSESFDGFMGQHKHGGMTGRYFCLIFDGWFDEMAKDRDRIVENVQRLAYQEGDGGV